MPRYLTALGALLFLASCSSGNLAAPPQVAGTSATPPSVRILALGDSYTAGEGVAPADAWPAQLAETLRAQDITVEIDVIAGTGWTAQRAADKLQRRPPVGPYDLVFVQVGVNDHVHEFGVDNYRTGLQEIVATALPLVVGDPSRVVFLSIVDWRVTPRGADFIDFWRSAEVATYNDELARAAAAGGHRLIDVTGLSLEQAIDHKLVAADGLHASAVLYEQWIDLIGPIAIAAAR